MMELVEFSLKGYLEGMGCELITVYDVKFKCSARSNMSAHITIRGRVKDDKGVERDFAWLINPESFGTIFTPGAITMTAESNEKEIS